MIEFSLIDAGVDIDAGKMLGWAVSAYENARFGSELRRAAKVPHRYMRTSALARLLLKQNGGQRFAMISFTLIAGRSSDYRAYMI